MPKLPVYSCMVAIFFQKNPRPDHRLANSVRMALYGLNELPPASLYPHSCQICHPLKVEG